MQTLPFRIKLPILAVLIWMITSAPSRSAVAVYQRPYHGWQAIYISNGVVEAYVVPSIGRIMSFELVGKPETNPIFENPDWLDKPEPTNGDWANYGGDKLWASPQSEWPGYIGHDWPPDPAFDGTPQTATILPDGVQLTTSVSVAFGIRAIRTITMQPGSARLYIANNLERVAAAAPTGKTASAITQRLGNWLVTQVRGEETVFVPLKDASASDGSSPLIPLNNSAVATYPYWRILNGMAIGSTDPAATHKVGFGKSEGWIAALYGQTLFSEHYDNTASAQYPDHSPLQVYAATPGATVPAYTEIENLGPLMEIPVGGQTTFAGYWQLDLLPRLPINDQDAANLVRKALK